MSKVSVILPFYNVENYIEKCIESVIDQTFNDIEIICIDDCSTDNTKNKVLNYMKKDSRIKLIEHSVNKGLGEGRNTGILASSSQYITCIDTDDYISKNFVECLYSTALKYNADMVFTDNIYTVRERVRPYYHNRTDKWKKKYGKNYYEGISHFNVDKRELESTREYPLVTAWNKMWKKSFLNDKRSFKTHHGEKEDLLNNSLVYSNVRLAEDVDFFYKALLHNPVIAYNHKAEYYYVQRESSLVGQVKNNDKIPTPIIDVFESVFNYYKERDTTKLEDCTYWNFRSFMSTFDNYKGNKKDEFYSLAHNMFKRLNATIDNKKYPFIASQLYVFKNYPNYNDYIKLIQEKKDKVYKIAWYIPTLALREYYRDSKLDRMYKNFIKN